MATVKEIRQAIKATKQEMKARGVKRVSCFNGGLHGEVYQLNAHLFGLETDLIEAKRREANANTVLPSNS